MSFSSKELFTTALAPITTEFPIWILPNIFAPGPIKQLSPIIGAVKAEDFAEDLNSVFHNLNDISTAVNKMAHDENLKKKFVDSVDNLNTTMCEVSRALETVNGKGDKENLKQIVADTSATIENLKKFSEKLNKRFLLFRLMF